MQKSQDFHGAIEFAVKLKMIHIAVIYCQRVHFAKQHVLAILLFQCVKMLATRIQITHLHGVESLLTIHVSLGQQEILHIVYVVGISGIPALKFVKCVIRILVLFCSLHGVKKYVTMTSIQNLHGVTLNLTPLTA